MNCRYLVGGVLAALALASVSQAQGISSLVVPQQSYTTGMIGFTTNQTARLSVLNLSTITAALSTTAPTATEVANCNVELAFYDTKGNEVSQTTVMNFAPGTATSFDLPRAGVTSATTTRAEIRGVVTVNPTIAPPTSTPVGYCNVMTTLEIYDATGSTVALTTTIQSVRVVATPVAAIAN